MFNVTCKSTPTPVLSASRNQLKRTVVLQNQSSEIIYLQFGPAAADDPPLSTTLGYQLAAGASKDFGPSSPGGALGCSAIVALSASGNAILHVQVADYTNTRV